MEREKALSEVAFVIAAQEERLNEALAQPSLDPKKIAKLAKRVLEDATTDLQLIVRTIYKEFDEQQMMK